MQTPTFENFPRELVIIYRISQAIVHNKNVNDLLNEVLDIIDNDLKAQRATLTLYHTDKQKLIITASKGLSQKEKARGHYSLGEGITGQVGQTREPVIIMEPVGHEDFLDRTRSRQNEEPFAFLCCPVLRENKLIGTISIDIDNSDEAEVQHAMHILMIIANLLAEAVYVTRHQVEEKGRLRAENNRLLKELGDKFKPSNIVGNCGLMQKVYEQIASLSDSLGSILVTGESGTGKELIAKAIHYSSIRRGNAFIALNCSTIPQNLLEVEIFGVKDGKNDRTGFIEMAQGGTLFLEEISSCSPLVQNKLARALQNQSFERIGAVESMSINIRLITASTCNIKDLVDAGQFNAELYSLFENRAINVPPLRDRKSDITLLADHFLEDFNTVYSRKISRISTPAINMMIAYHWPGNVRELKNCVERAVLNTTDDVIHGYNLPPSLQTDSKESDLPDNQYSVNDLVVAVNTYERELIVEALKKYRGNAAAAARSLNTTPRVLNYKFKKLNINLKDFKTHKESR